MSEQRGAFTWDAGNPASAPCFGAQVWTRHSRDLKSDLPFPWGSSLTLDYWLSGVPVLVCFFTDKKTGLRLAPRDISWQRILSTKHKLEKQEYHSNLLATSVTFATPNRESMAQANPTHCQDMVLLSTRKALCVGTYAAFGTPTRASRWCMWYKQPGGRNTAPLLDSGDVLRSSQVGLLSSDFQSQLVQTISFSVRVSYCVSELHEKSNLATDASGWWNTQSIHWKPNSFWGSVLDCCQQNSNNSYEAEGCS